MSLCNVGSVDVKSKRENILYLTSILHNNVCTVLSVLIIHAGFFFLLIFIYFRISALYSIRLSVSFLNSVYESLHYLVYIILFLILFPTNFSRDSCFFDFM